MLARKRELTPAQSRVRDLSQWFTEPWLADLVAEVAEIKRQDLVLEPSAGDGELVRAAIAREASVQCIEIDSGMIDRLRSRFGEHRACPPYVGVAQADFLQWSPLTQFPVRRQRGRWTRARFDVALQNPPYENEQDLAHVLHALTMVDRLAAILRLNALAGKRRHEALWSRFDVERVLVLPQRSDFGREARRVGLEAQGAESDFCIVKINARPPRIGRRPSLEWVRRS